MKTIDKIRNMSTVDLAKIIGAACIELECDECPLTSFCTPAGWADLEGLRGWLESEAEG